MRIIIISKNCRFKQQGRWQGIYDGRLYMFWMRAVNYFAGFSSGISTRARSRLIQFVHAHHVHVFHNRRLLQRVNILAAHATCKENRRRRYEFMRRHWRVRPYIMYMQLLVSFAVKEI